MGPPSYPHPKPWILWMCYIMWKKWPGTLRYVDNPGLSKWVCIITWALKSRALSLARVREIWWWKSWKICSVREIQLNTAGGSHKESMRRDSAASRHKTSPWLTAHKETATSILQPQGIKVGQQLE